jgi:octaprenyl-diphosphate synthase
MTRGETVVIAPLRDLDEDLKKVDRELQKVIAERAGALRSTAEPLFSSGGKRLRPAMALLTAKLFGPVPAPVVRIGAAVEMIHGASLIHDDVIDGTTVRRSAPTLNAVRGNHFSVLLGDFLLCQALLAIADLGRVDLLQVISQAVADMTQGQILEAQLQGDVEANEESYLQVVEGKTAALMAAGCELSALCCGANPQQVRAARELGRNIGLAFQIVDDILDIWGDPLALGKPVGSDLQEKKYTLPFIVSYRSSDEDERLEVKGLLGNGHYPGEHMPQLVEWMERHRARVIASDKALAYTNAARAALAELPAGSAREDLSQLLDMMMERQR